jgi:hypothetical protein
VARSNHITPWHRCRSTVHASTMHRDPVPRTRGRKRSHSASSDELRSFRCCLIFFGPDRFSLVGLMMRRISMAVRDGDSRAVCAGGSG